MSLLSLPNELLLHIAEPLRPKDLNSFLRTNTRFAFLLTPRLHNLAIQDKDSLTALQWAALNGHEPLVRMVLEKGADINHLFPKDQGRFQMTALQLAAQLKNESMIELLLENGADVSTRIPGHPTALHWAVKTNSEAIVRALLRHGADSSAADVGENTPLLWAIGYNFEGIVKILLENGADLSITKKGSTPLHWAARFSGEAIINMLLEYGVDPSVRDTTHGRTALEWATYEGHEEAARVLSGNEKNLVGLQSHTTLKRLVRNSAVMATESPCYYGCY